MNPIFWGVSQVGWQATATLVAAGTLIIGVFAAFFALNQLRAARQLREQQTRPYIVVDVEPGLAAPQLMDLVVRNIGKTPALDVKLTLDPTPVRANESSGYPLAQSRIFNEPIPMFAPDRVLRVFFDHIPERYDAQLPMSFKVTLRYNNTCGKVYDERSTLDMDVAKGSLQTSVYGTHHIAANLAEIVRLLEGSAIARGPLEVVAEDRQNYVERRTRERRKAAEQHESLKRLMLPGSQVPQDGSGPLDLSLGSDS